MKDLRQIDVMILDLDPQAVEQLQTALQRIGIRQIRLAQTTVELFQKLDNFPTDLLFLGDQLLQIGVAETIQTVRQFPGADKIPILWATQTRNPKGLYDQIAAGLAGVIWQPATESQFRRAVRRALHIEPSRDLIAIAKHASFFQEFSMDELRQLLKASLPCRFDSGEIIIQRGDPSDSFFVLLQGEVEIFLPKAEDVDLIATIPAGDSFGEMGILEGDRRSAYCIASHESLLLEIDSRILLHDQNPVYGKIMTKIATLLAGRLRKMNERSHPPLHADETSQRHERYHLIGRQIDLRLRELMNQIPQSVRERVLKPIRESWGALFHSNAPLHIVVATPWGAEAYGEVFHDLPFSHQLVGSVDTICHGTFLPTEEALDRYLEGRRPEEGDPADFEGALTHTSDDLSNSTLFFVYEAPSGEITHKLRSHFPENLIITALHGFKEEEIDWQRKRALLIPDLSAFYENRPSLRKYGVLFGTLALITSLAPLRKEEAQAALYGVEG